MFESGKPKLQTHCGVVLSVAMVVIILLYSYMKAIVMFNHLDNKIQEPTISNFFDSNFVYDTRDGWRVAFGLTAYDNMSDQAPFDETYGRLNAYQKIWGEKDADGNILPLYFKKLATEPCKEEDINLNGDSEQEKYMFY